MTNIGVISDTHSLVRPEAVEALRGSDLIIHAGDIGKPAVLDELREIAPLHVIRGNIDTWANDLPDTEFLEIDGKFIFVLHSLADLDLDPVAAGIDVVISGHSHKPAMHRDNGLLYLNPGSAGPRRFTLPIALAHMTIDGDQVDANIVELEV